MLSRLIAKLIPTSHILTRIYFCECFWVWGKV
jgi:hypothetical protein